MTPYQEAIKRAGTSLNLPIFNGGVPPLSRKGGYLTVQYRISADFPAGRAWGNDSASVIIYEGTEHQHEEYTCWQTMSEGEGSSKPPLFSYLHPPSRPPGALREALAVLQLIGWSGSVKDRHQVVSNLGVPEMPSAWALESVSHVIQALSSSVEDQDATDSLEGTFKAQDNTRAEDRDKRILAAVPPRWKHRDLLLLELRDLCVGKVLRDPAAHDTVQAAAWPLLNMLQALAPDADDRAIFPHVTGEPSASATVGKIDVTVSMSTQLGKSLAGDVVRASDRTSVVAKVKCHWRPCLRAGSTNVIRPLSLQPFPDFEERMEESDRLVKLLNLPDTQEYTYSVASGIAEGIPSPKAEVAAGVTDYLNAVCSKSSPDDLRACQIISELIESRAILAAGQINLALSRAYHRRGDE